MVFSRRTKISYARWLGRIPTLTVVNSPRMDHDHRRMLGAKRVGHLDDPPRVVGESPGAYGEVRFLVVDQPRRLVARFFHDRLYELGVVRQQRRGIRNGRQPVAVGSRCRRFGFFARRLTADRHGDH